jgi:hypothetical protein
MRITNWQYTLLQKLEKTSALLASVTSSPSLISTRALGSESADPCNSCLVYMQEAALGTHQDSFASNIICRELTATNASHSGPPWAPGWRLRQGDQQMPSSLIQGAYACEIQICCPPLVAWRWELPSCLNPLSPLKAIHWYPAGKFNSGSPSLGLLCNALAKSQKSVRHHHVATSQ